MTILTTLAHVKSWMNITTVDLARDATLTRLIAAQSSYIENEISRTIQSRSYTERRDGKGAGRGRYVMTFANDPVSAVASLSVYGEAVPLSPDGAQLQTGYAFDSNQIWVVATDNVFARGLRNVTMTYTGGFLVLPYGVASNNPWLLPSEVWTIPVTPFQVTAAQMWSADNGVKFTADGAALTKVASGTPTAGQYKVTNGVYTFAAADAAREVGLSYSYVPADIEQSCIELVGIRWKEKDRIGINSQAVGTESVSYEKRDMPPQVKEDLRQYKRVFSII